MGNRSSNQMSNQIDRCKRCLTEKLFIVKLFDNNQLLKKKSDLVNTCRLKNKLLLKSLRRNHSRNNTLDWLFSGKMIFTYWLSLYIGLDIYSNVCQYLFFFRYIDMYTWWLCQAETNSCILQVYLISET